MTLPKGGIWLTSDTHGCYWTLRRLLAKLPKDAQLVHCGDTIDRGPHSRQVVEYLMKEGIPTVMGNHEHMCLYWHNRVKSTIYDDRGVWFMNGGFDAMKSWLGDPLPTDPTQWTLPADVLDWMQALPYYLDYDGLLVSHSGHGKPKRDDTQEPHDMMLWYRDTHFDDDGLHRVFGHTQEAAPVLTEKWSKIDTGAAYAGRGLGTMTAFHWPSKKIVQQVYDETPL